MRKALDLSRTIGLVTVAFVVTALLVGPRAFARSMSTRVQSVTERFDVARSRVRKALDDRFPGFGPPRFA